MTSVDSDDEVGASPGNIRPTGRIGERGRAEAFMLSIVVVLAVALVLSAIAARRLSTVPWTVVHMSGDSPLLTDPGVPEELRAQGLQVSQNYMGSRAVAEDPKLPAYDVASVSSDDAAKQVAQQLKSAGVVESTKRSPMGTPMVVMTHRPIAELLRQIGLASQGPHGVWTFDMRAYIKTAATAERWTDIPGNTGYPSTNQILLTTTDPSASGSGELFLMVLSYILNGDAPIKDTATADRLLPKIVPYFLNQGDLSIHTPDLLNQFLTGGMDRYPMIFGYEGDYLAMVIDQPKIVPSDLVVMYPSPTAFSETSFVSWTPVGDEFNRLLATDPVLIDLEIKNGQRTSENADQFVRTMATHGVTVPTQLTYVLSPSDAILEYLIEGISRARQQAGSG